MISQFSKTHQSTFNGGLNKDVNKNLVEPDKYFDAQNLTLVDNNKFLSLQNIKGTTNVQSIINTDNTEVLAVFSSNYTINNIANKKCLTIFTSTENTDFRIYCYDTEGDSLYLLYTEIVPSDYSANDRVIDGFLYPENGLDIIYFTDNYNEVRKLRCEITFPYVANSLTQYDLSLQRFGALGKVYLNDISQGGSLLSGSYEFAYQLINPDKKKYSKFSLLSLPVKVFASENSLSEGNIVTGGVGATTRFKISLNIDLGLNESSEYTHFRLAVVENIYPEGTSPLTAQLTPIAEIADYLVSNTITDYEYRANIKLEEIQLSEIVVDLAAIDHMKTITVRRNRLIGGNITYKNTVNDKTQTVTGSIIKKGYYNGNTNPDEQYLDPFSNHVFASKYTGHFRDEVYRYGISYFDEYGNFSSPKVLNFESVTNNQIYKTPISSNLATNSSFTGSLSPWLQTGTGTSWAYSANTVTANILTLGNSQTLYQALPVSGKRILVNIDITAISGSLLTTKTVVVDILNGTTVVASYSLTPLFVAPAVQNYKKVINVPNGITGIGVRFTSPAVPGSVTIDNFEVYEASTSIDGSFDMKFPKRSDVLNGEKYTLFSDDKNGLQSLGLNLTIDNHPTFARGFVVLRAKRIENIICQTPLLPCMQIQGTGALEKYPQTPYEGDPGTEVDYSTAVPMEPEIVIAPPEYFWGKPVNIVRNKTVSGSDYTRKLANESYLYSPTTYTPPLWMIFPDKSMYTNNSKLNFTDGLYIDVIDAAAGRFNYVEDSSFATSYDPGTYSDHSSSTTIYALQDKDYYYDSAHTGSKTSINNNIRINGYSFFDNFSEGTTLKGFNVYTYDKLTTSGYTFGIKPNVQRSAIISLEDSKNTLNRNNSLTFASAPTFATVPSSVDPTFLISALGIDCVDTIEICNIVKNLSDDRYGDAGYPHSYISTGSVYNFTESELINVKANVSTPITTEVWGGDCTVSSHFFRITDSGYTVTNQFKYEPVPTNSNRADQIGRWGKSFETFDNQPTTKTGVSVPIALRIANQSLQVVLESKYIGEVMDVDNTIKGPTIDDGSGAPPSPHQVKLISEKSKTPLTYQYNTNFSIESDKKIFSIVDPLVPVNDKLKARLVFSDEKIYQSNIEGFDIFRVLNFYDLEETYGGVTKLSVVGNDMYAIQEDAIIYVGIGERAIETTDTNILTVKSGDVIGNVYNINTGRGGQHLRSIVNTGSGLYITDNKRKAIYRIGDKSLDIISDIGMASEWRQKFDTQIPEKYLVSIYDPVKKEILFGNYNSPYCYVFNENLNSWVSNYQFDQNNLLGGAYTNQKLYVVGRGIDTNSLDIHEMYTGNNSYLMGNYVIPSVKYLINPDINIGKTFNDLLINSSDRLDTFDILIERESILGNQNVTGIDLDTSSRGEGNFRVKTLRVTGTSARPRGLYGIVTINWNSSESASQVALVSTVMKYQLSENIF